jgi:peptidyl-prolyl cis-trans isomerase SurA
VPGGVSIIGVEDVRNILVADPRNAVLSLKQITVKFPAGTTREQAEPAIARFSAAAKNVGGCGGAEKLANEFNGEVIQSDDAKMRDLPVPLQNIMTQMQIGQVTPPFGSLAEGIRVLVLCGREIENPTLPSYDQVYAQLNEQRVNVRSRRYLRDLRRDAVIEFR